MKLLFLANRIPYPPYRGDKLKIYNLAQRLSKKHELYLLTFSESENDRQYMPELTPLFQEVHLIHLPRWQSILNCIRGCWRKTPFQVLYFQSPAMQQTLDKLLNVHDFDGIHIQHLRMAPYLSSRQDIPRILDLPDAFSLYWKRRQEVKRNPLIHLFEKAEGKRVLAYEAILRQFDLALVCSPEDQEYLMQTHPSDNIRLLPNGVDTNTFAAGDHDYAHHQTLLFTGNMDYAPNVDAVVYFTEDILPLIRLQFPDIRFIIAGQRPVERVRMLASDHISVTGFIKDLASVYNEASVVVAPLRFGAGTQNKVLEAMALGVPVVCSHIGFKGLGIASGEGAVMAVEKNAFAAAVCDLLHNETYRREVGTRGIKVIQERFDWQVVAAQLEHYFMMIKRDNA